MSISFRQCRAARAMLGWSQDQLGRAAQVAKKTIADFERGATTPHPRTIAALQNALEQAGITFVPDDGAVGAGLRMTQAANETGASN